MLTKTIKFPCGVKIELVSGKKRGSIEETTVGDFEHDVKQAARLGMEVLILHCASKRVDVESDAFVAAVQQTFDDIESYYPDRSKVETQ